MTGPGPAPSRKLRTIRRAFSRSDSGKGVRGSSRSKTIESAPEPNARSMSSGRSPPQNSTVRSGRTSSLPMSVSYVDDGRAAWSHLPACEDGGRLVLAHRAFEEARVHPCVQADCVEEHQLAKAAAIDHAAFDKFIGLLYRLRHVRHVPVRDVRPEHGTQSRTQRVHRFGKGPGDQRVGGF